MISHLFGKPDFFEQIALGNVPKKSYIYKFGRNGNVGATETLISSGGVYGLPTTAEQVLIVSDDAVNDNPSGDGARTVHIFGLDENWENVNEIVEVGGASVNSYKRVFRAHVETAGTITPIDGGNVGTITVVQAISTVQMVKILPHEGQTLTACFTIPAGYTGLMWSADTTTGEGKDSFNKLMCNENYTDSPFRVKGARDNFQNSVGQQFAIPTSYPEKTDIVFTSISSGAGVSVAGTFLIELVKNQE